MPPLRLCWYGLKFAVEKYRRWGCGVFLLAVWVEPRLFCFWLCLFLEDSLMQELGRFLAFLRISNNIPPFKGPNLVRPPHRLHRLCSKLVLLNDELVVDDDLSRHRSLALRLGRHQRPPLLPSWYEL
ncbi:hypothetical protein EJ08DRAFT_388606 [Tothia fuscella]|uniref:Uncharacterized protein n=1 Tax=Tothia fuscella TaxID=1048955 RepID=A0A9P4NZ07_9PEZI|nr:hypothetical protein EJ08DRAFT_388606 [Tothia fuscella]